MENRIPELCRSFVRDAKIILSTYPQVKHAWSIDADEDRCILDIPKIISEGFDIHVEVNPSQISIFAQGSHYLCSGTDFDRMVEKTLELIQDLISGNMRIKEYSAGGSPYRWVVEVYKDGQWQTAYANGRLLWNYFGRRTHRVYKNKGMAAGG